MGRRHTKTTNECSASIALPLNALDVNDLRGSFTLVVGAKRSGKSSLCRQLATQAGVTKFGEYCNRRSARDDVRPRHPLVGSVETSSDNVTTWMPFSRLAISNRDGACAVDFRSDVNAPTNIDRVSVPPTATLFAMTTDATLSLTPSLVSCVDVLIILPSVTGDAVAGIHSLFAKRMRTTLKRMRPWLEATRAFVAAISQIHRDGAIAVIEFRDKDGSERARENEITFTTWQSSKRQLLADGC